MSKNTVLTTFIALLRAVNVGGTGKLPMADLKALCQQAGFTDVRTYIASGNVVFGSELAADDVQLRLHAALLAYAGKPVGVLVRTHTELAAVLTGNPFASAAPNRTVAIFLDNAPALDALGSITGQQSEQLAFGTREGTREIYVHYGEGMANSKLRIPAAKHGTARNMNTVAKLVELSAKA